MRVVGRAQAVRGLQIESHTTAIGFVQDVRRVDFHGYGKTNQMGMVNGLARAVGKAVDDAVKALGFDEVEALEDAQLGSPGGGRVR